MSLINDMLKNIERRQSSPNTKWHWGIHNLHEEYEEKSALMQALIITIITLVIIGLVAGGIYAWHHFTAAKKHNAPQTAAMQTPSAAAAVAAPSTPAATTASNNQSQLSIQPLKGSTSAAAAGSNTLPPPPSIVSGLSFNDIGNQLEVTVEFSSNAPTYLTHYDKANNIFKLTLQNLYLEKSQLCKSFGKDPNCIINNTIPMPINSSAIKSITIAQNDGQALVLDFNLLPGANFSNTVLLSPPNKPGLVITLNKPSSASSSTPASTTNAAATAATPTTAQAAVPADNSNLNSATNGISPSTSGNGNNSAINTAPDTSDMLLQPIATQNVVEQSTFNEVQSLINLQKYTEANALVRKLSKTERNSIQGIIIRAKLLLAQGKQAEALDLLQSYNAQNPPADYYALLAAALEFNGQHLRAMAIYQNLISYWPKNPNWWLGLGISALNSDNYETASRAFQHVLAFSNIDPEIDSYVHLQLANLRSES